VRRHVVVVTIVLAATAGVVFGQGSRNWRAALNGFNETNPGTVSTVARGAFSAEVSQDGSAVNWTLSYRGLEGDVTQAHIHFGAVGTSGGISVFLCTNLGNTPTTVPAARDCPPSPATITGTFSAVDVVGPTAQGIAPGEYAELLRAIRAGHTYANVHSLKFPNGEVRGPLEPRHNRGNDDNDDDNSGHGH
jgi:CHRD domain